MRIYTIGYGNKSLAQLQSRLEPFHVVMLVDVRSSPYSKYMREFDLENLRLELAGSSITYEYLGDLLGGMPKDPALLTNGRADLEKLRASKAYESGLNKLKQWSDSGKMMALLCGCSKPMECHRGRLLGPSIEASGWAEVWHIDMDGNARKHENSEATVQLDLF